MKTFLNHQTIQIFLVNQDSDKNHSTTLKKLSKSKLQIHNQYHTTQINVAKAPFQFLPLSRLSG